MNLKYFLFGLLFYLRYQINQCYSRSITYINLERPDVAWFDKTYCKNFTLTCKRLNRQDPRHYVELYVESLITVSNNLTLDLYFYQFLTNRYRPSFVEMHLKLCDMINSDLMFGQTMRDALGGRGCPFPPGVYHLQNMSIPYVPKGVPFPKGRVYVNISLTIGGVTKLVRFLFIVINHAANETDKDTLLCKVKDYVHTFGWPLTVSETEKPYLARKKDLGI